MTDTEYKIPFYVRFERQLESAERSFRSAEHPWTWDIIRKMVEEESKYDADIITYLKDEIRKFDEKWKQWELENEGKVWWHNSKINKFSIECPGEGWVLGMIFRAQND
jgi:hypothetical protein